MVGKMLPKDFWKFIDETQKRVEDWVRENTADKNFECCRFACDIMYRILADWKIHEKCGRETLDDVMSIMTLWVRGIQHDVILLFGYIHDPTHMQFNPQLTKEEYATSVFAEDFGEACEMIFRDAAVLEVCKEIRPELYR